MTRPTATSADRLPRRGYAGGAAKCPGVYFVSVQVYTFTYTFVYTFTHTYHARGCAGGAAKCAVAAIPCNVISDITCIIVFLDESPTKNIKNSI